MTERDRSDPDLTERTAADRHTAGSPERPSSDRGAAERGPLDRGASHLQPQTTPSAGIPAQGGARTDDGSGRPMGAGQENSDQASDGEALGPLIRQVLKDAPFAMRQLAADSGLSYDVLRSWRSGRRRPSRSSAARLAEGLRQRAELLDRLARQLREAARGENDDTA
jgi:hypothetical protein